jgi:hypothetical protein
MLIVVAMILCGSGCRMDRGDTVDPRAEPPVALRDSPGKWMVRTELVFGLGLRDGTQIADEQWLTFLRDEIAPRFPAGHTIIDSRGQWRDEQGRVQRESSRVVVLIYEPSDRADDSIEQIRLAYKRRFDQDSVMRTDSLEKVSF